MSLRIYNTKSGRKEEFVPCEAGRVGMYVCGVTVYDLCHLGHARGALVFDVVRRYLARAGYRVTYVRNFTDIDDKIIARAAGEGVEPAALAERFIKEYVRDMEALGVRPADIEPRATEHVGDIVRHVEGLVERGAAYVVDGDVYFRVGAFAAYGALSGRRTEEMIAGARVEVDERKEDPLDFALWKASKPGEPWWESPWGRGRPGWHIECSAMSAYHLGGQFDIHGGGKDLIFPHHENEIAQSEALTGRPFVRYWMHNGFVNVDREKMSKSLGNFFTIREVLERYDPEAVRLFLLSTHYRSPIDFTDRTLAEVTRSLDRFYLQVREIERRLEGGAGEDSEGGEEARRAVEGLPGRFDAAMADDFNTAEALGEVFKTSRAVGAALAAGGAAPGMLRDYLAAIAAIGEVLGVLTSRPDEWARRVRALERRDVSAGEEEWIAGRIAEREAARAAKEWDRADRVRDELLEKGIVLEDSPGGTVWRRRRS